MALETVYQGFGFSRAIAFLRNPEQAQYVARMWFGEGVQEIASRLVFADAYQPDVFHAVLAADKMIFVEYALDAIFVNKVPRWWRGWSSSAVRWRHPGQGESCRFPPSGSVLTLFPLLSGTRASFNDWQYLKRKRKYVPPYLAKNVIRW